MWKLRVARAVLAGPLFLCGLALPAQAGDLFRRHHDCGGGCPAEVVKIPGHQIVVETARPQVVVNETRVVHARPHRVAAPRQVLAAPPLLAAPPVFATIFTPMQLPMAPMAPVHHALAACPPCPSDRPVSAERSALSAIHEMEATQLEARKLHLGRQLEMAHAEQAFQRVSASLRDSLSGTKLQANGSDADLRAEVARLHANVTGLNDNAKRVEGLIKELQQLVIAHDEVIKKKVLQENGSSVDLKRLDDRIKEMQRLVLTHDDMLRELVRQRGAPLPMPPAGLPVPPQGPQPPP